MRATFLLLATESEAGVVLASLAAGADFAEVAALKSVDAKTASQGGDLGWVSRNGLEPALGAALQDAKPGDTVGPIAVQNGRAWVVVQVLGERDQIPFEEAAPQVKHQLQSKIVQDYVEEVRASSVRPVDG